MLTHRVPDPPNRGDRIRAHHMLRHFTQDHQVYLGCLAEEPVTAGTRHRLASWCAAIEIAPLSPRRRWLHAAVSVAQGRTATVGLFYSDQLHKRVRQWARTIHFDAVVVFCSSMLQYAASPELATVPLVVDLVDVDSQKWFDYATHAKGVKRWLFQLEGRRLRQLEKSLPARARGITLVSEAEADIYRSFCPNERTYGVPNGVDLEYFQPAVDAPAESGQCLFLGALDYRANIAGLEWFCQHVWPEVHRRQPRLRLVLVGRRPAPAVIQLSRLPGVELVGEVPDVRPYLAAAEIIVAPLQIARGIQNKVLEALASGKPVIASTEALEGLALVPGRDAVEATTPIDWIEKLLSLTADAPRRKQLAQHGRIFVEAHHHWQSCLVPLAALLDGESPSIAPAQKSLAHDSMMPPPYNHPPVTRNVNHRQ